MVRTPGEQAALLTAPSERSDSERGICWSGVLGSKTSSARRNGKTTPAGAEGAVFAAFAQAGLESPTFADANLKVLPLVIYDLEGFEFDLVELVVGRHVGFIDQPVLILQILENAFYDIRKSAF